MNAKPERSGMKPSGKLAELARIQQQGGDKVVLPLVEQHLLSRWGDKGDRNSRTLHVSEIAKKEWCERASYQRITGGIWPEEPFSFTLQSIFDEGHQIHDKWQSWLADTGKLWGDWECVACGVWIQYATRPEADERADSCLCRGKGHLWMYKEVSLAHGLLQGREDGARRPELKFSSRVSGFTTLNKLLFTISSMSTAECLVVGDFRHDARLP